MAANVSCPQCGAAVSPNTRFCSECGFPIQAEFYQSSAPGGPVPATQKMDDLPDFSPYTPPAADPIFDAPPPKKSNRTLYIILGGLAVLACCCIAGLLLLFSAAGEDGTFFSFSFGDTATPTATNTAIPTATFTATPTLLPTATQPPAPTQAAVEPTAVDEPPSSGPVLTGQQRLTDTEFFDDFSSDALDWPVETTADRSFGYENEAYAIHVLVSNWSQLIRPPLDTLTHLEATAFVAESPENGLFGVTCYNIDNQNYHYVEFDDDTKSFRFGQIQNGEWKDLSDWIKYSAPNPYLRIAVDCSTTQMVVNINGAFAGQVAVSQAEPGEMWLFVSSWADAPGGLKVNFDDVGGYLAAP